MYYLILSFLVAAITAFVVLKKFQHYKEAAHVIKISIFIMASSVSVIYIALSYHPLAPYFAFGVRKTLDENITVVKWHQRIMEFSNGETVHVGDLWWLILFQMFAFIMVGGTAGILLKTVILLVMDKFFPEIHEYLISLYYSSST